MSNREGWCAGDIVAAQDDPGRGRWLTVWGSYHTAPDLYRTRQQAEGSGQRGESVAHVTEVDYPGVGRAYQVTPGTLAERMRPDLAAEGLTGSKLGAEMNEPLPVPGLDY